MPLPLVYIETTVVSYLASRPSRDLITAANQQVTHEWWDLRRTEFTLRASEAVLREAQAGDPQIAAKRMALFSDVPLLTTSEEAIGLAEALILPGPLPLRAATDALHIAIAAVHRVDYLMTWNLKHIHNAEIHKRIRGVCEAREHELPVICTPAELMGG